MTPPKISVIIPVYNVELYLEECLDSILGQSFQDFELICVDDGSTDSSPDILKKYAEKDKRVIVVTQANAGVSAARNAGIKIASGEYIVFIDSDDLIAPGAFARLYEISSSNNLDVLHFNRDVFFETPELNESHCGEEWNLYNQSYQGVYRGEQLFAETTMAGDHIPMVWLHFISREYLNKIQLSFYDGIIHEDELFCYLCDIQAERIMKTPEVFYHRRIRANSIMTAPGTIQNVIGCLVSYMEIRKFAESHKLEENAKTATEFYLNVLLNSATKRYMKLPPAEREISLLEKYFTADKILPIISQLEQKMMTPKISIIIPVFNKELYLGKCLDKVLKQTLREIEVICVDDGSTDASLSILEEYAKKDNRVIVLQQENAGPGPARNNGLRHASGEYVHFLDADDFYPAENVLELLYNAAVENNVKICGGSMRKLTLNEQGEIISENTPEFVIFEKNERIKYADFQQPYYFTRYIYDRVFLQQNNIWFPDYRRYEDPLFFVKAMILAKEFFAIKDVVYHVRLGHQTYNYSKRQTNDILRGITDVLELSKEHKLEKMHTIMADYLNECAFSDMIAAQITCENQEGISLLLKAVNTIDATLMKSTYPFLEKTFVPRVYWTALCYTGKAQNGPAIYTEDLKEKLSSILQRQREILQQRMELQKRISEQEKRISEQEEEIEEQTKKTLDQEEKNWELRRKIFDQEEAQEALSSKMLSLQNSLSYRVGLIITALPRLLNSIRKKGRQE